MSQSSTLSNYDLQMIMSRRQSMLRPINVRQAYPHDIEGIKFLVVKDTETTFGEVDVLEKLDLCVESICIETEEKEIVGCVCFDTYPNIPSIPPWEWKYWIYKMYHLQSTNSRNTYFIHLAVWNDNYIYSFLKPTLKKMFSTHAFLEYIILVVPPHVTKLDWLEDNGTRVLPCGFSDPERVQTLYLFVRQHFITKYKIRKAVEEDNDDLIPLMHRHSKRLQEYYGEYYIAEMLTRHLDAGRQLIVAEYKEKAVAVLCLNETVNLNLLNESFELVPFLGLRKSNEENEIVRFQRSMTSTIIIDDDLLELQNILTPVNTKFKEVPEASDISVTSSEKTSESCSSETISLIGISPSHLILNFQSIEDIHSHETQGSDQYSAVILSFDDYEMHLFKSRRKHFSAEDVVHSSQMKSHKYTENIPKFDGEINAFTIEIAAAQPQHETEALTLLIEAAFECFTDRDYCIVSVPSHCPQFSLVKNFCRASPRPVSSYPQELYILHHNVVLSTISVRYALPTDIPTIEYIAYCVITPDKLISSFKTALTEDSCYTAFVLLSENEVVGAAVVGDEDNVQYLENHYFIMDWINEDHHKTDSYGHLEYLILSPLFQTHAKFFLKEIHRLTDYSVLFYRVYPPKTYDHKGRTLCCVLSDLMPVPPRQIFNCPGNNSDDCSPTGDSNGINTPFALFLSTARYCSIPRFYINRKIVIVGTSDTALAFLNSLLCCTSKTYSVTFTNVTVVSPHGVPYQKASKDITDMMFVKRTTFNYRHTNLISLMPYLNVVNGVMVGIDRKNKLLILNENNFLAYDMLFLFCGEQFQRPTASLIKSENRSSNENITMQFPENVFLINTETDATNALLKLKNIIIELNQPKYTVIVYGEALEAYTCLASLLEYGIPGSQLVFVEPFPKVSEYEFKHRVSHFNDGEVDEAVLSAIKDEGITVYSSYYFVDWTLEKQANRINSATFEERYKKISLDCIAMFMYNNKLISTRTFLAIIKSGLVFDGALVIDPNCRTNDPNIYAAGTITKYSRRYYADHMVHKYYNLEEIGYKLGQKIRRKLMSYYDEIIDIDPITCTPGNKLVPTYEKPLMTYCRLPGNLRYFHVEKPGKRIPMEVDMNSDDYGVVLVTGEFKQLDKQGLFRLQVNKHGIIETITCLARFDIDSLNLTKLWGKHEKLLNNLQMRFEMGLILDLFDYFKEPWCCAIYHDRFSSLEKAVNKIMTAYTSVAGNSLIEDLMKMFKEKDWEELTIDQKEETEEKFMDSPYHKMIEEKVLEFIHTHRTSLNMYAHTSKVRHLLEGHETSPLFKPQ